MVELSIVIPAYNEDKNIIKTLESYCDFLNKKNCDYEIIIVNDGSQDKTKEVVEDFIKKNLLKKDSPKNKRIILINQENQGKGSAVLKGFKNVKGNLVCYVDADNATKVDQVWLLKKNIGDYDGIIGSRWVKGSEILRKQPFSRRVASRGYNFLVRSILGLKFKDTQNGGKIFRRELIMDVLPHLKIKGWGFDVGVLYHAVKRGYKMREFPISWEDNPDSKLNMRKVVPEMFKSLVKLRFGK